jgi:hypothetical protein
MIFANSIVMPPNNTLVEENPRAEYFAEQDNEVVKRIWFVWVEDSTGKTYRKDIYLFPTLWRILFWLKYKK